MLPGLCPIRIRHLMLLEGVMLTISRRRTRRFTNWGITALADVPPERASKVLHLCRWPADCCPMVCDRHKVNCRHRTGR